MGGRMDFVRALQPFGRELNTGERQGNEDQQDDRRQLEAEERLPELKRRGTAEEGS